MDSPSIDVKPIQCLLCTKIFASTSSMAQHQCECRDSLKTASGSELFDDVDIKTEPPESDEERILSHADIKKETNGDHSEVSSSHHEGDTQPMCTSSASEAALTGCCSFGPYKCEVCGLRFSIFSALFEHTKFHKRGSETHIVSNRWERCDLCCQSFICKADLKKHMKLHNSDPRCRLSFICNVCLRNFVNQATLTVHLFSHSDEEKELNKVKKAHSCGECKQQLKMVDYMLLHTGKKP